MYSLRFYSRFFIPGGIDHHRETENSEQVDTVNNESVVRREQKEIEQVADARKLIANASD